MFCISKNNYYQTKWNELEESSYQSSTIILTSDNLILTESPMDINYVQSNNKFKTIINFNELWCEWFENIVKFKSNKFQSDSINKFYSKRAEYDQDCGFNKCNISTSSGISTASFEEDHDLTASIDSNQVISDSIPKIASNTFQLNQLFEHDYSCMLVIGKPLCTNWVLKFSNKSKANHWKKMIDKYVFVIVFFFYF